MRTVATARWGRAAADGHDWANNSDGPGPGDWSIICEVTRDWGFT